MQTTTYYDLNIVEGTDIVNPLTVDNPNYQKIDEEIHKNAISGVTLATEIQNATVHAINRENSECSVIRFIATSNWKAGDTVTVDGVQVTALLPSGEALPDGAYVINANVLCILTGTNLTVYVERKKIDNATEIAYNDTNVANELDTLNNDLSNFREYKYFLQNEIFFNNITANEVSYQLFSTDPSSYRFLNVQSNTPDAIAYISYSDNNTYICVKSYKDIPVLKVKSTWLSKIE